MKPDLLVALLPRQRQLEQLERDYTLHRYDLAEDKEALLAKAGPICRAMFCNGHFHVDDDFLAKAPALEMVAATSAGYEAMDVPAMTARGIRLTNTSEALTDDVADMALLLTLAARRRFVEADAYVRSGEWAKKGMFPLTTSASGKRAGIIGLGRIGAAIAKRYQAIGLEIGYYGRSKKAVPFEYFDDPVKLAEWADILICATSGGPETAKLVSKEVLAALGPTGSFINISRGTVVDEAALIAALKDGIIASAGLDVYASEPDADPALTSLKNAVFYPHHSSGTEETRDRMHQLAVDNIAAFYAGSPLLTQVA